MTHSYPPRRRALHACERDATAALDRILGDRLDAPALVADGELVALGHVRARALPDDDLGAQADRSAGLADRRALPDVGGHDRVPGVEDLPRLGQLQAIHQRTGFSVMA